VNACSTAWKIPYGSRREALTAAHGYDQPNKNGQVKAYQCGCGSWHLTSMSRRAHKLIGRAKRAATRGRSA